MIVDNKISKPLLWDKTTIKNLNNSYKDKKLSYVCYSRNDSLIIKQISFAIENAIDFIISDLLHHELPPTTLMEEYNFFSKRYVFISHQSHFKT